MKGLIVLVIGVAALVAAPAALSGQPTITRTPITLSLEDDTDCGFPVFISGGGTDINITNTLADGTIRSFDAFTSAKLTVTNIADPSKSVTVSSAGSGHATFRTDGSATIISTGPAFIFGFWLFPGIHWVAGRWTLTFDASGNPTFRIVGGTTRDLCAAVA
jgi:hypothetical protein